MFHYDQKTNCFTIKDKLLDESFLNVNFFSDMLDKVSDVSMHILQTLPEKKFIKNCKKRKAENVDECEQLLKNMNMSDSGQFEEVFNEHDSYSLETSLTRIIIEKMFFHACRAIDGCAEVKLKEYQKDIEITLHVKINGVYEEVKAFIDDDDFVICLKNGHKKVDINKISGCMKYFCDLIQLAIKFI